MNREALANANATMTVSPAGRQRFLDAKFGMCVHWGVYSAMDRGEWVLYRDRMDMREYEEMARKFNPLNFNADEWIRIAADAGQKMFMITSKHHDGYCLYDSELTDYSIKNSAFGRDPVAELAEACEKRGVALHLYYSLVDWHHPAFVNDWDDYVSYYHGQVRELCTRYGKLGGIFFDGCWPNENMLDEPAMKHFCPGGDWEFGRLYDMIHSLQPDCVITNNTHIDPLPGEDYQVFEQDLPGENTAKFNTTRMSSLPLASLITMNDSWCYRATDTNFKPVGKLIELLLHAVGRGGVFLLNTGPDGLGRIPESDRMRLAKIGEWMRINSDGLYGTALQRNNEQPWGYAATRDDKTYLYLLHWPGAEFELKSLPVKPKTARILGGGNVEIEREQDVLKIRMPGEPHNPRGSIIELR